MLNKIRKSHPQKSTPKKLAFTFLALLAGFGLAILTELFSGMSARVLPQWLESVNIRNLFATLMPWALGTLIISLFSRTPIRAAINVFTFSCGLILHRYPHGNIAAHSRGLLVRTRRRNGRGLRCGVHTGVLVLAGVSFHADLSGLRSELHLWSASAGISGGGDRNALAQASADPLLDDRRLPDCVYLHTSAVLDSICIRKTARLGGFLYYFQLKRFKTDVSGKFRRTRRRMQES